MFQRVLIANRGEIACRAIRTLQKMGLVSLSVYAPADAQSLHVRDADVAIPLGGSSARDSYLNVEAVLARAHEHGAQAIFPGYGFLSENADFAARCHAEGLVFIGPTPEQIRAFGLKHEARALAKAAGVPLLPGSALLSDLQAARRAAAEIGYPVMLKSTAGGGGIGLSVCSSEAELDEAYARAVHLAESHFGDGGVFVEKFVSEARHIEVQVFGDGRGRVISLGERDCSVQRRNQKVIEETPAPDLPGHVRQTLADSATRLLAQLHYRSAGTVEFVYDAQAHQAYFLEVNTRLQVEHPVTERVTGVDLVQWMIETAQGRPPDLDQYIHAPIGHAIEVRVYAENPHQGYRPSSGLLTRVEFPTHGHSQAPSAEAASGSSLSAPRPSMRPSTRPATLHPPTLRPSTLRVDTWIETGVEVSSLFDPMLAKLIAWGPNRDEAVRRLASALEQTRIDGIETNLPALRQLLASPALADGAVTTRWLSEQRLEAGGFEVVDPGRFSTIQDHPGRVGYWEVGIPPSGAMDTLSMRLGNRVLGNPDGAAAIEMTATGVSLRFFERAVVCLSGADMGATLDGMSVPRYSPVAVRSGQLLKMGQVVGPGARAYLCVHGGIDVPEYLGSRSTFTLGRFGGHGGRTLRLGDVLYSDKSAHTETAQVLPSALEPELTHNWTLRVVPGPHAAPDFFTDADIATFYDTEFEVHYNSARTGVRLIGPKPQWARTDGGDAGLHPSNIHDCAYAFGTVDYTGDMPILLGPDGPSLGGFVCPATVISADLWKLGQLAPGDKVRFEATTWSAAHALEQVQEHEVLHLLVSGERHNTLPTSTRSALAPALRPSVSDVRLHSIEATNTTPEVCYRPAGDKFLLVEYGPMTLDLQLRFRVHALQEWLREANIPGILETTAGIRSLQIHYDSLNLRQEDLTRLLSDAESKLPDTDSLRIPSRVVHLPLSWDDEATQLAVAKYAQLVRKDAPWSPSNIEFIRRINGLSSTDEVRQIVYDASYLVLGLGDVYLGAPVATPIDPRHRLVTTKYNPARTWTPENAVGIGGAYLCIYGMEGPGGYQLVGRSLQMFNRFRTTQDFQAGTPWLLRHFDQIRFFPVTGQELLEMREAFAAGRLALTVEEKIFDLVEYRRFLNDIADSADAFKRRQTEAFEAERQRWADTGQLHFEHETSDAATRADRELVLEAGLTAVASPVPGSVWRIAVRQGEAVAEGQKLMVLESMKMEMDVAAPAAGIVERVLVGEGDSVHAGQTVVALRLGNPEPEVQVMTTDSNPDEFTLEDSPVELEAPKELNAALSRMDGAALETHAEQGLADFELTSSADSVSESHVDLDGAPEPLLPHPPPPPPGAEDPFGNLDATSEQHDTEGDSERVEAPHSARAPSAPDARKRRKKNEDR